MERKLKDINNLRDDHSIVRILQSLAAKEIDYDIFRKGLLAAIAPIREKIKISEEDIKTIFYILDSEHKGTIDLLQLEYLSDIESLR